MTTIQADVGIEESARKAVLARYVEISDKELPFELVRLAIHQQDIKKFHLPPLRVKDADPRADGYRRRFGGECVELDALPPSELRRRIKAAVRARRDETAWGKSVHIERVELDSIVSFAGKLQNVKAAKAY